MFRQIKKHLMRRIVTFECRHKDTVSVFEDNEDKGKAILFRCKICGKGRNRNGIWVKALDEKKEEV